MVKEPIEFRCPKCQALLYSRKSKLCGQCGTVLPEDLPLTPQQIKVANEERAAEHDAAESFEKTRPQNSPKITAEQILARAQHAKDENRRQRWTFWIYLLLGVLMLAFLGYVSIVYMSLAPAVWLVVLVVIGTDLFRAKTDVDDAICPDCQQNIRFCPPEYCHMCGKPLRGKGCLSCGVNYSFIGRLMPTGNKLNRFITYCPGCGVFVGTMAIRHEFPRG